MAPSLALVSSSTPCRWDGTPLPAVSHRRRPVAVSRAVTEDHWQRLCAAVDKPDLVADVDVLEPFFASRSAAEWFGVLDSAGVPCEISDENWVLDAFDNGRAGVQGVAGLVRASHRRQDGGVRDAHRLLGDARHHPPAALLPGQHTREIMAELGTTPTRSRKYWRKERLRDTSAEIAAAARQL